jgi:hypothetical protein
MPGTPIRVRSWADGSRRSRASASRSRPSSWSRPTSGVSGAGATSTPRLDRGPSARQTATGSALPLASTGPASSKRIARPAARRVVASTRIPSTGAAAWSRAAVLTTSPEAIPSPSTGRASRATSASPVVTPMRTCRSMPGVASFSSAMASQMARAARTARSGSSSWATGAPNRAITASPMNFSTVPPKRSSSPRSRW